MRRMHPFLIASLLATGCYQIDTIVPAPRGDWIRTDQPEQGAVCVTGEKGYFCSLMVEIDRGARQELCWAGQGLSEPEPAAEAFVTVESLAGLRTRHVRITFATWFVDNTYGARSSDGWGRTDRHVHQFEDLVGSDHLALSLRDAAGARVLELRLDYLSSAPGAPSGWASLGPAGGDGALVSGDGHAIVAVRTSLDQNLNERGCVFVEDSPTPTECSDWDQSVVYELWVEDTLFGPAGAGPVEIESVHASPSRAERNSVTVDPAPCD